MYFPAKSDCSRHIVSSEFVARDARSAHKLYWHLHSQFYVLIRHAILSIGVKSLVIIAILAIFTIFTVLSIATISTVPVIVS